MLGDDRGTILELIDLRQDYWSDGAPYIYTGTCHPGRAKGWGVHKDHSDRYMVIAGELLVVLYDDRDDSPTRGVVQEFYMTRDGLNQLRIPPGVWHAQYKPGKVDAIFVNAPTQPYDHGNPDKWRLPIENDKIPYSFAKTQLLGDRPRAGRRRRRRARRHRPAASVPRLARRPRVARAVHDRRGHQPDGPRRPRPGSDVPGRRHRPPDAQPRLGGRAARRPGGTARGDRVPRLGAGRHGRRRRLARCARRDRGRPSRGGRRGLRGGRPDDPAPQRRYGRLRAPRRPRRPVEPHRRRSRRRDRRGDAARLGDEQGPADARRRVGRRPRHRPSTVPPASRRQGLLRPPPRARLDAPRGSRRTPVPRPAPVGARHVRIFLSRWQEPAFDRRWGPVAAELADGRAADVAHECATWNDLGDVERLVAREASRMLAPAIRDAATHAANLTAGLEATRGTLSWRLTAPLRALRRPGRASGDERDGGSW